MKDNVEWIDRWRGILIFLVVFGHVVGGAGQMGVGVASRGLERICDSIYFFHMPAFFCIAGALWKRNVAFDQFLAKKFVRLIVPYFFFGIISSVVYLLSIEIFNSGIANCDNGYYANKAVATWKTLVIALLHGGGGPNGFLFRMNSVLWFPPCLFAASIVYYWIDKALPSRNAQMIVLLFSWGIAALIAKYPNWILPMGLMRVPGFLGYMILGRWFIGRRTEPQSVCRVGVVVLMLLGLGAFSVFCIYSPNPWIGKVNYFWHFAFRLISVIGISLSIFFAFLLKPKIFAILGKMSLTIMLLHKFPVEFLRIKLGVLQRALTASLPAALIAAFIISVVAIGMCIVGNYVLRRFAPWSIGERKELSK